MQATQTPVQAPSAVTSLAHPTEVLPPSYTAPSFGGSAPSYQLPQASYQAAVGAPNAWRSLAVATGLRAGLIGLGFYLAGVRSWKPLVFGSLGSSATLSFLLTVHHAYAARRPR